LQGMKKAAPTKPREDFTWDDQAILSCFELAVNSHCGGTVSEWKAPDKKEKQAFVPKPVPLPNWAVDPLLSNQQQEQKKQSASAEIKESK